MKEVIIFIVGVLVGFIVGVLVGLIGLFIFTLCMNVYKSKNQNTNVENIEKEIFKLLRLDNTDRSKVCNALKEEREKYGIVRFFSDKHIDYSICVIQTIYNKIGKNCLVHSIFYLEKLKENRLGGLVNENLVSLMSLIIGFYGILNIDKGDIANRVCISLFFIITVSFAIKLAFDSGMEPRKRKFYFDIIEMVIQGSTDNIYTENKKEENKS